MTLSYSEWPPTAMCKCKCKCALMRYVCVCVCVCVHVCVSSCAGSMQRCIVSSMHSSIHRFDRCLDSFFDSSMYQTRPMWKFRYPLPVLSNLLCSCCVNVRVVLGVILLVLGSIFMSFWCPWEFFGDLVPSRGPPKGAESKM